MLLFLIAPPAHTAPAPPTVEAFQDQLRAIARAAMDGKSTKALVGKARDGWTKVRPALPASLSKDQVASLGRQMDSLVKMRPLEQAVGAMGVASALAERLPRSPRADLDAAERAVVSAWCWAENQRLDLAPNVENAFKPVLAQDQGRHTAAAVTLQEALKRLKAAEQKKQPAEAKKALKEIAALVDVFRAS